MAIVVEVTGRERPPETIVELVASGDSGAALMPALAAGGRDARG